MPLVADSSQISLGLHGWVNKAHHAITELFAPADHSPEMDLLSKPMRDARLAPRAPMSNADLDVGLLNQLSSIGLKRAKQVTAASHPELMQAWEAMAQRAGLPKAPQLIIAESDSLNALTVNKDEVTITTGLLRILDLREAVAVLGHELGHVQSDHVSPRIATTVMFGGAGALLGNELGRYSAFGRLAEQGLNKWGPTRKMWSWIHPNGIQGPSLLGSAITISAFGSLGAMIGRHFSVRPTELDADAKGAAISGDPQGLAAALGQLQSHSPRRGFMSRWAQMQSGYPSTEKRIASLQAMAPNDPVIGQIDAAPQPFEEAAPAAEQARPRIAVSHIAGTERVSALEGPAVA